MSARWLSEHRRLLAAMTVILALAVVALATAGSGSSAASRRARPAVAASAALAAGRRQLLTEQAQVARLQALNSKQATEISSLKAQLRAPRVRHHNRHHTR